MATLTIPTYFFKVSIINFPFIYTFFILTEKNIKRQYKYQSQFKKYANKNISMYNLQNKKAHTLSMGLIL
ncbi:hypothetical protein CEP76_03350 [[Haemophilus] ducreyi]|nr:hypothetical protein A6036_06735 [[Haemophilus] ducreyi]ANF65529.1 hypothetical protein A6039_08200 [[Haemophilus] ducreyi]ANF66405.1 hypothetical protein A6040_04655 [[Haemophilus] ducreyi]ANF71487.1 hypothetical protein A6044_00545 [[Haemophilus] ducreyi]ASE06769.1 hypothetical protein CEP76_03350 [[Haemophilus] ducreyi]